MSERTIEDLKQEKLWLVWNYMPGKNGKITDGCTTGKVYKVYKEWCRDNNNGFAKTYKEFRIRLADHLGTSFEDMIVKRSSGTFYKDFTLTQECKKEYASAYGYDDIDFPA